MKNLLLVASIISLLIRLDYIHLRDKGVPCESRGKFTDTWTLDSDIEELVMFAPF